MSRKFLDIVLLASPVGSSWGISILSPGVKEIVCVQNPLCPLMYLLKTTMIRYCDHHLSSLCIDPICITSKLIDDRGSGAFRSRNLSLQAYVFNKRAKKDTGSCKFDITVKSISIDHTSIYFNTLNLDTNWCQNHGNK